MMPTSPAQTPARVPCATWRREGQPTAARKVLMPCSRFRPRRTHFARHVDGHTEPSSAVDLTSGRATTGTRPISDISDGTVTEARR